MEPLDETVDSSAADQAIAEFLLLREGGNLPDRAAFLEKYPHLRADLEVFFAADSAMGELAAPPLLANPSAIPPTMAPTLSSGDISDEFEEAAVVRYVGDYVIEGEIARGGMGVVYRARQVSLNRSVALKMMVGGTFVAPAAIQRFRYEAEAAASLDHPNIVPVYEVGEHEGMHYFSMKLIEGRGRTLADYRLRPSPTAPNTKAMTKAKRPTRPGSAALAQQRRLAEFMAQAARAVHFAHERGIIHRDIKPGNILVNESGAPQLTDFGLAKQLNGGENITHSGDVVGTPAYMAPEQASGNARAATTLADVYGLGAVLYYLLADGPPFRAENTLDLLVKVANEAPVPPSQKNPEVDRDLEAICQKCLEKPPAQRYASAAALAQDLDHWRLGQPISVRPASLARQVWLWMRRHVHAALWVVLIACVCSFTGQCILAVAGMGSMLYNVRTTYEKMPSVTMPGLAYLPIQAVGNLIFSPWLLLPTVCIGIATTVGMGMFAQLAARTRDVWSDLAVGLLTGIVAAVVAFASGIGPALVIAMVIVPRLSDLDLVHEGCFANSANLPAKEDTRKRLSPQERLVQRYPDLATIAPNERGAILYTKGIADMVVGSFAAIWGGMALCLINYIPIAIQQVLTSGYLTRRYSRLRSVLFQYLEICAATAMLLWPVALLTMNGIEMLLTTADTDGSGSFTLSVGGVFRLAMALLIFAALWWDWPIMLRLSAYFQVYFLYQVLKVMDGENANLAVNLFALVLALVCFGVLIWERRRVRALALSVPCLSPKHS